MADRPLTPLLDTINTPAELRALDRSQLRQLAELAPNSTVVMTFLLPAEYLDEADRPGLEMSSRGAQASGTPFVSFYSPEEIVDMAEKAGFGDVRHVSSKALADRYFADRTDGLRPSTGEDILLART